MAAPQTATKEQQKIFAGFKRLREEQQALVGEIQRFAAELRETQNVLNTLNKWDNTERTFYYRTVDALLEMNNTTIVERLTNNITEIKQKLEASEETLKVKAKQLNDYKEKHQIKIVPQ